MKWFYSCFCCFLIQILLLNKTDLFQEKIRHSGRHLRLYFSNYEGRCFFPVNVYFSSVESKWSGQDSVHIDRAVSTPPPPPPQELTATWTPPPISSQPCSRRVATDPCSTTTPRPRTRPTFSWSSTWSWTRSAKTTWHLSSCCDCLLACFPTITVLNEVIAVEAAL